MTMETDFTVTVQASDTRLNDVQFASLVAEFCGVVSAMSHEVFIASFKVKADGMAFRKVLTGFERVAPF